MENCSKRRVFYSLIAYCLAGSITCLLVSPAKAGKAATVKSKTFSTEQEAIRYFQDHHQLEYTSRFDREPLKRPDYIPESVELSNGQQVAVVYDSVHKGYGYSLDGEDWTYYDPTVDPVMMETLLGKHRIFYEENCDVSTTMQCTGGAITTIIIVLMITAIRKHRKKQV